MKIAIIGAGPSGLVTAKTLVDSRKRFCEDIEVTVFEAEEQIGGTFRYRSYESSTLVSSKQLTSFSDFRLPLDSPDHLSLDNYCRYLEDYVSHFKLKQNVDFKMKTRVIGVERGKLEEGGHWISYQKINQDSKDERVEKDHFTHISICTGLHVSPSVFKIPGLPFPLTSKEEVLKRSEELSRNQDSKFKTDQEMESYISNVDPTSKSNSESISKEESNNKEEEEESLSPAQSRILSLHSSAYSSPKILKNKSVLIMGTGETGMDISYLSIKGGAKQVTLTTRSGFLSFPAVLSDFRVFGIDFDGHLPIDGLITNLFETAYVHPYVAKSHLRWFVSDAVIKKVLWFLTGTQAGCNQWVGELPDEKLGRAYVFLNKSAKAMPYLNRKWKNRSKFAERLATYIDGPDVLDSEPSIDLSPPPSYFTKDGQVIFQKNGRKEDFAMRDQIVKPDVVIYGTGYKQTFPFLDSSYPNPSQATCRDIIDPKDPTVSFIGFVRPGVGAIPPQSELAAQLWTLIILNKVEIPTSKPHYYLLSKPNARINYGVDYSSYVSQLARDMGSAPSLGDLFKNHGFFITFVYCFAAAFPTLYRLKGPWKDEKAGDIVKTEIWDTVKRRGLIGNIMMGLIPMLFYAHINLAAYLLEKISNSLQFLSSAVLGKKRDLKKLV